MPIAALIIVTPWLLRNLNAIGMLGSPETGRMFFFTDHNDHYAYGRNFTWHTMLAAQTPMQIIGKRLFELAAAFKVMIESLDVVLPVAVTGGLILLILSARSDARDRSRLLVLSSPVVLILALLIAYPILIPYKSQAGSFKKAYISVLPLIVPIGAYAFERAMSDIRIRVGAMVLVVALAGANAIDAERHEITADRDYLDYMNKMLAVERTLPDTNGDGKVILMVQDPYIMRYLGIQSIMFPDENRDKVIQIARRYEVDYLLMPPNRPALDPLLTGEVVDPRYVRVATVPGTNLVFYKIGN
ncbi:MAG: hypothetical protein C5B54_10155 [Acidobacteria bacterium]|nr:MAG: hypothetical protein C5B54_10155 [Acidobacteriota bacterium]